MSNATLGARVIVMSLILCASALFSAGSTLAAKDGGSATAGAKAGNSQVIGQLIVTGSVTVNEKKAITGTTVFTDSRITVACAKGSSAIVNLGRLGRIELVAGASLTLRFSDGLIAGDLAEGKALISTPAGVRVSINTPNGITSGGGLKAAVTPVLTARAPCAQPGTPVAPPPAAQGPTGAPVPTTTRRGGTGTGTATWALLGAIGAGEVAAIAVASGSDDELAPPPVVSPTVP